VKRNAPDVTMTDITSDDHSFVPFSTSNGLPNDDSNGFKVRKRNNESPTADSLVNKKGSARNNSNERSASPIDHPIESSPQNDSNVPNFVSAFRYSNKDKPPFIVQVQPIQESDSTNLHPLHISRILSQIYPKGVLEIKKTDRNRILTQMCTYEAANRLVEDKFLATRNLKAFVPLHRILRTGIIRDVPQDFSIDMLKDSITSPVNP